MYIAETTLDGHCYRSVGGTRKEALDLLYEALSLACIGPARAVNAWGARHGECTRDYEYAHKEVFYRQGDYHGNSTR